MNCKKCGESLDRDIKFCGKCGTKVEHVYSEPIVSQQRTCKKCNALVREGAKFCKQCGSNVDEVAATMDRDTSVISLSTQGQDVKKSLLGLVDFIRKPVIKGVGGILLVVIILTVILSNLPKSELVIENQLMLFKYEGSYYGKYIGKEKFNLKLEEGHNFLITRDSKKVYSLERGDLYSIKDGEDREKIASDVTSFAISAYGDTVAYVKGDNYSVGELYVKSGTKQPERISTQVLPIINISENGKYVTFIENDDTYNLEEARGYIYQVGTEKQKLSKMLPIVVNDKGTIIGSNTNQDLYMSKTGKDSEKIGTNISRVVVNKDLSKIMFLDNDNSLYFYNGKDKERIERGVSDISAIGHFPQNILGGHFMQLATVDIDLAYIKNGLVYFKIEGQEAEKIDSYEIDGVEYSDNMRSFAYISRGNFYIKQFNNKRMIFNEKIDSDVTDVYMSKNGEHVAYIKDDDLYYIQPGKKESIKVAQDIYEAKVQNNGTIFFEDYDDNLYMSKNKKDKIKLISDVQKWVTDSKGNLYIVDKDDTLYEKEFNKEIKKIAEDIYYNIYFPYTHVTFAMEY